MEIHPPRRIESLKDFFRELLTITAGILIALMLEGLVQWFHHRDLARDARANILAELRENQRALAREQLDLQKMRKQSQNLIALVHRLQINRKTPIHDVSYIWSNAELHSTSWRAAITTGAIAYLPYDEVKWYTETYDLQQVFVDLQQRSFASALAVEGLRTLLDKNSETISQTELSNAEQRLGLAAANVNAMQDIAKPLNDKYEQLLNVRYRPK